MPEEAEPVAAEPACPICNGRGEVKQAVPYWHPKFAVVETCVCKLATQEAERQARQAAEEAARKEALRQRLVRNRGRYATARIEQFNTERELPGPWLWRESHWNGRSWVDVEYSVPHQREMLRNAKQAVMNWLPDPRTWLYFQGSWGSGKTLLAIAALNELEPKYFTIYGSVSEILDDLRDGFKDNSASARFREWIEADALVVDDLGAAHLTDWGEERLFEMVRQREIDDRITIFTSNDPIEKVFSGRVGSRIAGRAEVITLVAYDHRILRKEPLQPRSCS
ncbi:MAG: hypothetical protein OHK0022_27630 [Roseiflexaceae bacterium]